MGSLLELSELHSTLFYTQLNVINKKFISWKIIHRELEVFASGEPTRPREHNKGIFIRSLRHDAQRICARMRR